MTKFVTAARIVFQRTEVEPFSLVAAFHAPDIIVTTSENRTNETNNAKKTIINAYRRISKVVD
jgi:hypothetical protein